MIRMIPDPGQYRGLPHSHCGPGFPGPWIFRFRFAGACSHSGPRPWADTRSHSYLPFAPLYPPAPIVGATEKAITEGIDALGEVTVRIESNNGFTTTDAQKEIDTPRTFGGHGADTDIIVASVKAYLAALNKMLVATGKYTQHPEVAAVLN